MTCSISRVGSSSRCSEAGLRDSVGRLARSDIEIDPTLAADAQLRDAFAGCLGRANLALPQHDYAPAEFAEGRGVGAVPLHIPAPFGRPELGTRGWGDGTVFATVTVPEAAVYKDRGAVLRQHDVRPAGQVLAVQAVTEAHPVQDGAHAHLRPGVRRADRH